MARTLLLVIFFAFALRLQAIGAPSSQPTTARGTIASAQAELSSAKASCLRRFHETLACKELLAKSEQLKSAIAEAKNSGDTGAEQSAIRDYSQVTAKLAQLRSAAIAADPQVRAAADALARAEAESRDAAASAAAAAAERKAQQERADLERAEKDPIYKAFREHRICVGMPEAQMNEVLKHWKVTSYGGHKRWEELEGGKPIR